MKLNWGFFPLVSLERKNIPKQLFLSKINFSVENKIFNNNSLVHDDSAVDYPHQSNIISCLLQSYDFWSMNLWLEMKWRISLSQSCTHWPVIFGKDNTTLDVGGKWIRREFTVPLPLAKMEFVCVVSICKTCFKIHWIIKDAEVLCENNSQISWREINFLQLLL